MKEAIALGHISRTIKKIKISDKGEAIKLILFNDNEVLNEEKCI